VLSVVLTGLADDGAAGSKEVLRRGGVALAQEPASAEYPSMPRHALATHPDVQPVSLTELASAIGKVVAESPGAGDAEVDFGDDADVRLVREMAVSAADRASEPRQLPGDPSLYNCRDCNGALQEASSEAAPDRWRCRVGHGWSAMALAEAQAKAAQVDSALWAAVHLLDERALLCERLADRAAAGGRTHSARQLRRRADETSGQVELLRALVIPGPSPRPCPLNSAPDEPTPSTPGDSAAG